MQRAIFKISEMDCPSEEQLIRMALGENANIKRLIFDLPERKLEVILEKNPDAVEETLAGLNLGSQLLQVEDFHENHNHTASDLQARGPLIAVLSINAVFFVVEMIAGLLSQSMGLIADSLDMLADSFVYGLSLLVIGKAMTLKRRIARLSGYTQLALASAGVIEVVRRFIGNEAAPDFVVMATVASLALSANVLSLFILARTRDKGVHLQASWIFTSNDVIANLGVLVAALLVYVSGSKLPDLIVGILIFGFVGYGALRILRLAKS
ncbi:MAG: cation transporter [bacterium]|nr:cation transporter [bacterium]